jgi:hypothetical protein
MEKRTGHRVDPWCTHSTHSFGLRLDLQVTFGLMADRDKFHKFAFHFFP